MTDWQTPPGFEEDPEPPPGQGTSNYKANGEDKETQAPLAPKSMADLAGLPLPVRHYLWDKWIPGKKPVLIAGKGGIGKTTLLCQFGAVRAIATTFLGLNIQGGSTLALLCEDSWDDAHLMLARLAEFYGRPLADFRDFHYLATLGDDNALVTRLRNGSIVPTPRYERHLQMIGDLKADFQFIDNSRHVALINENDGSEVTTAWRLLHALMAPTDGATALVGHTPKNNSAEFSGNASWENFARCRLFMGPAGQDPDAEPVENDPRRVLRRGKSNADGTSSIDIVWERGAFRLEHPDFGTYGEQLDRDMRRGQARQAFLDALDVLTGQQRSTSHGECTRNYAPKVMAKAGLANGFSQKELETAMNQLFKDGRIKANQPLWKGADRHDVVGIARCGAAS